MKDNLTTIALVVLVVALLAFAAYWKVSVWQECRETNSFGYCWALISR